MIASSRCALVVGARDGSTDERARLLSGAAGLKFVAPLDAATLGAAFGRDHIVHVALAPRPRGGAHALDSARVGGGRGAGAAGGGGALKQAGA